MINQGINVPENTIAYFQNIDDNRIVVEDLLVKPPATREWFDKWFYNCLPLTIGNQYGFILKSEQAFNVIWNGGEKRGDTQISFIGSLDKKQYTVESHFGHGVITVGIPFVLRTPPGINLMTISPPNYIMKNATPMTGVIESDNIRLTFTFNIKIQQPNVVTHFPAGEPLAAFIPIPRYFADSFKIINGKDLFDEDIYNEEVNAFEDHTKKRVISNNAENPRDGLEKDYFYGKDVYGNSFKDHQGPSGKKTTLQ